jgi:isopenicillin-N epimerase
LDIADIFFSTLRSPSSTTAPSVPRRARSFALISAYQRWQRELEHQPVEFLGRRFTDLKPEIPPISRGNPRDGCNNQVYTTNLTTSFNIVAHSLSLGSGDEALSTDHEYGAINRT